MTTREFLNAVISESANAELTKKAQELLTKHDAANAKRRSKPSKTQEANEPIKQAILSTLNSTPQLTTAVAASVGITSQKAGGLLVRLMNEGAISQTEISVKGKGKQKGWFIPSENAE